MKKFHAGSYGLAFLLLSGGAGFAQENDRSPGTAFSGPSLERLGEAQQDIDRYEKAQDAFSEDVEEFLRDKEHYNKAQAEFDRAKSEWDQAKHLYNKAEEDFQRQRERFLAARDKYRGARERFQEARRDFFGGSISASSRSDFDRRPDRRERSSFQERSFREDERNQGSRGMSQRQDDYHRERDRYGDRY